ncbi:MAG TPA: hypothetical protein VLT86_08445 [Vicinamibacterales bacterium]|nr:hypothetical protein [Vicinamibacterales bacterium]
MRMLKAWWLVPVLLVAASSGVAPLEVDQRGAQAVEALPARLTDQDFWRLSADLSEPNGFFRSENLVSNEHTFQYVVPALARAARSGGVYLGVAPDQNFTYLIATRPSMAFIVDIRRGNLLEHLMYKAIVELSADRAEFLSRLFARKRPAGLPENATPRDLFQAFDQMATTEDLYRQNVNEIEAQLTKTHGFPLSAEDLQQLEGIYFSFFWDGPDIRYSSFPASFGVRGFGGGRGGGFGGNFPSYEELMLQTDMDGVNRSYLASEENFRWLKRFEEKNLLVPVVGNFAGPKALRAVGRYIRDHGSVVTAFYVSNVEQYLFQDSLFDEFARNVATLPLDGNSVFIRSVSTRFGYRGGGIGPDGRASALDPMRTFVRDFLAGKITTYFDVNARSK